MELNQKNHKLSLLLCLGLIVVSSFSETYANSSGSTTTNNNSNIQGSSSTNSRVYKSSQRNSGSGNYWPRDSYVDAADYSANGAGFGSGTTGVSANQQQQQVPDASYGNPSGGFQGGNGNVGQSQNGHDGAYGVPEQSSAHYSYGVPSTEYHHHKENSFGGYGWPSANKPEGPSYKFKYHVYPHEPTESSGWGWSAEEAFPCRRGEDCGEDGKGGGGGGDKGGLAGLIGLLGLKGLLPLLPLIPLLLLPLLLVLPLPFVYFPPNTLDPNTGILKLGRGFSSSVGSFKNETSVALENKNYYTVDPEKILKSVEGAGKFVAESYTAFSSDNNGNSRNSARGHGSSSDSKTNSCMERFSCEIYAVARSMNVNKYLDTALQKMMAFKSRGNAQNFISRFSRGLSSDGDCQSFTCRPFFKAEKM